jgi:hypothetical protein
MGVSMKTFLSTVAAAGLAIAAITALNSHEANAQGKMGASGTTIQCPNNTCGKQGGPRSTDVKYCSAANCKKAPK